VHSRGSASKTLRGLAIEGEGPIEIGTTIVHPDRADAGRVTSATVSPEFGSIALGYLHRTAWEPGAKVEVGTRSATIVELPFGS
jgi:glycine cleavage system aminomethyltransferase T